MSKNVTSRIQHHSVHYHLWHPGQIFPLNHPHTHWLASSLS